MKKFKNILLIGLVSFGVIYGSAYILGIQTSDPFSTLGRIVKVLSSLDGSFGEKSQDEGTTMSPAPGPSETPMIGKARGVSNHSPEPTAVSLTSLDRYVRECPKNSERDLDLLAEYLQKPCISDLHKARVIYTWLADRVAYDDKAYNSKNYSDYSAENVLKTRVAVCAGFADLFTEVGKRMGLEVETVSGYAKGYGYKEGTRFSETNHAWNMVRINNEWRFFDATWGGGVGENVRGKLVSKKKFEPYHFNMSPEQSLMAHFPEKPERLMSKYKVTKKEWESWPRVKPTYFKYGFDAGKTIRTLKKNPVFEVPKLYSMETDMKIFQAPAQAGLRKGKSYIFTVKVPQGQDVALIQQSGEWLHFKREGDLFDLIYSPSSNGEVKLSVKYEGGGDTFHTALKYRVKP